MSDQIISPSDPASSVSSLLPPPLLSPFSHHLRHVTICSVYPGELNHRLLHERVNFDDPTRPSGSGFTSYHIPAVPIDHPDAYELLNVWDGFTSVLDTAGTLAASADYDAMTVGESSKKYQLAPVPCNVIAYDLIRHWSGDAPGAKVGLTIGVGAVASDLPTPTELQGLRGIQTAYFRFLVEQADAYHSQGLNREITDYHRRALRWLGSEDREWFKKIERSVMKSCPACDNQIKSNAIVCQHCHTNLTDFYAAQGFKLHEVEAVDPIVGGALRRLLEQAKKTR